MLCFADLLISALDGLTAPRPLTAWNVAFDRACWRKAVSVASAAGVIEWSDEADVLSRWLVPWAESWRQWSRRWSPWTSRKWVFCVLCTQHGRSAALHYLRLQLLGALPHPLPQWGLFFCTSTGVTAPRPLLSYPTLQLNPDCHRT